MTQTPPHPDVIKARDAFNRGDVNAAVALAEARLAMHANDVDALELRYLAHQHRGDIGKAAETLQAIIALDRAADWAFNELIQLLFTHGRRTEAEQVARAALRANPRNGNAHQLFGTLLSELNDLPSGEWHFRRALELLGEEPQILANLALNLMQQGRTDEAERSFARADALAPADLKTLAHWAKLHEVSGNLPRAEETLARAAAAASAKDVDLLRASFLARAGRTAEALAVLDAAPALNGDGQLERGRLLDRLGRHREAWADFVAAKRKLAHERGGLVYTGDAVETFFARLKRFFTRENFELLPQAPLRAGAPQPIFILGFPRSGTTLVEQILSSHSAVRAGGELPFIADLRVVSQRLLPAEEPFPDNLAQSWTADNRYAATLFRDYYLARAEQYGLFSHQPAEAARPFFTDKMPFNEIWLPLLRMAFPEAKVVHVRRHPLDVCVSMLSNNFTHGFNCGYRMEDIAHHLAAVTDLVEHYRSTLGLEGITLRYESLAADPEGQTRELLEALGLPFEPACLRFHESRRYAPTPSYAQVTQPLNDRSVGRYRQYAEQLRPLLPQLSRVIAAAGYEPVRT